MPAVDAMTARLVTVRPDESARLAVARMLEDDVGSVAVCEGGKLVGIFTERDVLRLAGGGADLAVLRVGDVMTTRLHTIAPDDDLLAAAELMQEKRIRHLPVIQDGNLLGMLGIREVLRTLIDRLWSGRDERAHATARDLLRRGT